VSTVQQVSFDRKNKNSFDVYLKVNKYQYHFVPGFHVAIYNCHNRTVCRENLYETNDQLNSGVVKNPWCMPVRIL
ncbi:unnamed protein product, partial [Schistosoma curassoni]|uniref:ZP domain-containing protein n=1 Tax=Schistosoma curassoni TaxID=6186 RepID=A0A183JUC2_9TREM